MKKAVVALASGLVAGLAGVAPVLAQSEIPPPEPGGITIQPGDSIVTPPGGTAFTGSDVQVWMVLAALALLVGLWLVIAGRRRARTTTG